MHIKVLAQKTLRYFLPVAAMVAPSVAHAQLANLRFVSSQGGVSQLESVPAPGGEPGTLRAEIAFQSDRYDQSTGYYSAAALRVLWWLNDPTIGPVAFRDTGNSEHDKWQGEAFVIGASIVAFSQETGAGIASIRVPVGPLVIDGYKGVYTHLFKGEGELHVAMGWSESLTLEPDGSVSGVLSEQQAGFTSLWPDVWLGHTGFDLPSMWKESSVTLITSVSSASREFAFACIPEGYAEMITQAVSVPANEAVLEDVRFKPLVDGEFYIVAKENGQVVAQTESILATRKLGAIDAGTGQELLPSPEKQSKIGEPLYKECHPAGCVDPNEPGGRYKTCTPCTKGAAGITSCVGSLPGQQVIFYWQGECSFAFWDTCSLRYQAMQCGGQYIFDTREVYVCGSHGLTFAGSFPFGGPSVSMANTENKFTTCCFYIYDTSSSASVNVMDCD